jgi:4-amino-4-deoxy-L-arabinose transferase-like glycosyltransferase
MLQPMTFDEGFTYIQYSKYSIKHIITTYDYPNNHVFHSLLVKLAVNMFGNEPWVIRIPAFIAGVSMLFATYYTVKKIYNDSAAFLACCLVACNCNLIRYSTCARGYTIIMLLTLVCIIALDRAFKKNSYAMSITAAVVAGAGFYSIPIMLYAYCSIVSWYFLMIIADRHSIDRRTHIILLVVYCLASITIVCAMYFPIIHTSGINAIISNRYVEPMTFRDYIGKAPHMLVKLWKSFNSETPFVVQLLYCAALMYCIVLKSAKNLLLVCALTVAVLLSGMQRVIFENRMWLWIYPFLIIGISTGLAALVARLIRQQAMAMYLTMLLGVITMLIVMHNVVSKHPQALWGDSPASFAHANEIALFILEQYGDSMPVVVMLPESVILEYYFDKYKIDVSMFAQTAKSIRKQLITKGSKQFLFVTGPTTSFSRQLLSQVIDGDGIVAAEKIKDTTSGGVYLIDCQL